MALAKSVSKLLLAASAFNKARLLSHGILCSFWAALRSLSGMAQGGHYSSQIQIHARGQNRATIRVGLE